MRKHSTSETHRVANSVAIMLATVLLGTTGAIAADPLPIVESAVLANPPASGKAPAQLAAPEIPAINIALPATVVPPDAQERARRRASDLNSDGRVDQADLDLLKHAYGPCPGGQPCRGDLNGDNVVDDKDAAILTQYIGAPDHFQAQPEIVGSVFPAPPALISPLPQQARADGSRAIKLELTSANAKGLRLQFTGFRALSGLELRIYDPAGTTVLGPYTSPHLGQDGTWWSPTIFGDTIGVELTLPTGVNPPPQLPDISAVGYLFCNSGQCGFPPGTPLACNNDVTCYPSWATADAKAIAVIYFVTGSACGQCSGSLLNRGPADGSPLFATANHCISTQAEADSVDVIWQFVTTTCNGTPPTDGIHTTGSLILKRLVTSDSTLLGLYEPPAVNFYLGSNPNSWSSGDGATGVHHPLGSFKRISFGSSAGSTDGALFCDSAGTISCTCSSGPNLCIAADVWNVSYTSGTTQPGSSGSPIFDSTRHFRGTLTGGPGGCPPVTCFYGRYDRAYANWRYYIDNGDVPATTVFVDGSVAGDPGQNGNSERGTVANPFNTVYESTFCVRSGQDIQITPRHYNEQMTVWRPMTLRRSGSSGTVTIGRP